MSETHFGDFSKIGLIKLHSGEQTQFQFIIDKTPGRIAERLLPNRSGIHNLSQGNLYRFDNGTRKGFVLQQGKTLETGYLKVSLFPGQDGILICINRFIQINNLMIPYRIPHVKNANHPHIARSLNPSMENILSKAIYLHSLEMCISNSNLELVFRGREK